MNGNETHIALEMKGNSTLVIKDVNTDVRTEITADDLDESLKAVSLETLADVGALLRREGGKYKIAMRYPK